MQKRMDIINVMMEMCMWICSMCMICRVYLSDVFSISRVNICTA